MKYQYPNSTNHHKCKTGRKIVDCVSVLSKMQVNPGIYEQSVLARRQSLLSLVETDEQFMEEYIEQV